MKRKNNIALVLMIAVLTVSGCTTANTAVNTPADTSTDTSINTPADPSVNSQPDTKPEDTGKKGTDTGNETKKKLSYEEQQQQLFTRLSGVWTSENGDYFKIYQEERYVLEYSIGEDKGTETPIYFRDGIRAIVNNISIYYAAGGDAETGFTVLLAEDGQSFTYEDAVFCRE